MITHSKSSTIEIICWDQRSCCCCFPSMIISFGENRIAPNELLSNLITQYKKKKYKSTISSSSKKKSSYTYLWIWIVVPQDKLFIWVIVNCRNVTRLQNSTLHHLHYISVFAPIDCCTCLDIILKENLTCLGREVVGIKNQKSIFVTLGLEIEI